MNSKNINRHICLNDNWLNGLLNDKTCQETVLKKANDKNDSSCQDIGNEE